MNCSIPGLPVHYQWTPRACSNSYPLSWWCHPIISSSVVPFSSCHQSFPASGSFLMSWLFASCGQGIGASASASALPMSIHGWFPLESTCLIFLQSKGLSRVFSNTTIWKHQWRDGYVNAKIKTVRTQSNSTSQSHWPGACLGTVTYEDMIAAQAKPGLQLQRLACCWQPLLAH